VNDRPSPGVSLTAAPEPAPVDGAPRTPSEEPRREIWFHRRLGPAAALRELWRYRELVLTLAERDLRVRYKQAVLGIAWALVTPLLLMLAFTLIFTKFTDVSAHGVPYPLFASIGLVPWTFFSTAFSRGGTSLLNNIPLLNKLYCPREVFPLSSVVVAMADGIAAALVLALLFPITGYAPQLETLYAPLLLAILLFFTLGVTLAMSAIVVYVRDLQVVLPIIVQFGLFVTPVGYAMETVVHNSTERAVYAALNPLAPVIDGLRRGILYGDPPLLVPTLVGAASSVVVLAVGFVLFKRMETGLADIA
jgi:ABC-2 type transport system permease protein/lipopolysaccharide transport system permease protein